MGFMEDIFARTGGMGDGFRMIQTHDMYWDTTDLLRQEAELRQKCERWGEAVNTDEASRTPPPLTSCLRGGSWGPLI